MKGLNAELNGERVYDYADDEETPSDEQRSDFRAFVERMGSGHPIYCTSRMFNYWLGVLPPAWMGKVGSKGFATRHNGECFPAFCFAEGREYMTAFGYTGEERGGERVYWAVQTTTMNPYA